MKILNLGLILSLIGCTQGYEFNLGSATDNFEQNVQYNNKVDIVWVIDNSSSMLQHQTRLIQQVPLLVSKLNSLKMDYHMAVVSTSMGGANPNGGQFIGTPKFLTSKTSDLQNLLSSKFNLGQNGSNNERGMESLEAALSSSYLNGAGAGFFRSDALLAVIALTDEDDKSGESATYYDNFFTSIKPDFETGDKGWLFNFIGVLDLSPACRTFNDYSEPGLLFMDLADRSGGKKESICASDLSAAVSNIHARIVSIVTEYKLNRLPVVSSIKVFVNGQLIPEDSVNGWTYFADKNVIRFNGTSVPPADAKIRVDFAAAEAN